MRAVSDSGLMGLVLVTIAAVLAGPVVGRIGHPTAANALILAAAGLGVASFALAGAETLRALRTATRRDEEPGRSPEC